MKKSMHPNITFDDLMCMNREQLLNLHLPDAFKALSVLTDIEEIYSAKIEILVSMQYKTQAKIATFPLQDLDFLGPVDQVIGSLTDGHLVFKHPTRNHCILVDMIDSRFLSFGTLCLSDLEVSIKQDKKKNVAIQTKKQTSK